MLSNRFRALVAGVVFAAACSGHEDAAPADRTADASQADTMDSGIDTAVVAADGSEWSDDGGLQTDGSRQVGADAQTASDAARQGDSARDASAANDGGAPTSQCPGTTPTDFPAQAGRCRTAADCHSWERCGPRYEPSGCGACKRPERACEDGGCASGLVCLELRDPCSCGGPGTLCQARCTASSCAADEQCGADGKCAPRSCKQGYTCTAQQVCAPDRMFADAHGCAVAHCDSDHVACPDGFRCEATLSAPGTSGCVSIHCNDGFACAPNRVCSATSSQPHGCEFKPCAQDKDCGCGVCIGGGCQDELMVCSPPPAP